MRRGGVVLGKQKTEDEISLGHVGSEMRIRDRQIPTFMIFRKSQKGI